MPGVGSGSRPACLALISSQWAGMMLKKTFPAMIVPSIAPTWRNAARGWKSWAQPHAASAVSTTSSAQSTTPVADEQAAEDVVDDPGDDEEPDADPDRLPRGQVGDVGSMRYAFALK